MTERTFAAFLRRSLALLERDCPEAYGLVGRHLGARRVAIEIDGERLDVYCREGRLHVTQGGELPPAAEARSTRGCLIELLDAATTLNDAVLTDGVALTGALDDLVAFHDALLVYFRGAVNSPAFPELLEVFLGAPAKARDAAALH